MTDRAQVAVVGAGTMGHGLAQVFAQAGHPVRLTDADPAQLPRAHAAIERGLAAQVAAGRLNEREAEVAAERVEPVDSLVGAVGEAAFVFEAVLEKIEIKQAVFSEAGEVASPDTILASNTSTFDIDVMASVTRRPERVIGAHWFNPPQIVPCVEVIPGTETSDATIEATVRILRDAGKAPSVVKNVPAFVSNRIQVAMAMEALRCLADGLATAEEIDRIARTSFGFRLAAYGPLEIMDHAGIDAYRNSLRYLCDEAGIERFAPPEGMLDELVDAGRHGVKSGRGFYEYEDAAGAADERNRRLLKVLDTTAEWEGAT